MPKPSRTTTRRNPQDLTLRNLRAMKKRIDESEDYAMALYSHIVGVSHRVTAIEKRIGILGK